MRRTVFLAAMSWMCVLSVSAQQHNIDTQKSTLAIHVSKTGVFSAWDTSTKCTRRFTAARQTQARILRLKYTWMRVRCA